MSKQQSQDDSTFTFDSNAKLPDTVGIYLNKWPYFQSNNLIIFL